MNTHRYPAQTGPKEGTIHMDAQPRDGLYNKFRVERTDGRDKPGGDRDRARYFVLDYAQDPYAKPAVLAYADACEAAEPGLAADLRRAVEEAF